MLNEKRQQTPENGVNLCILDTFPFPAELALIRHYETRELALKGANRNLLNEFTKLILIFPDGATESIARDTK
jgi:hypothetical protein